MKTVVGVDLEGTFRASMDLCARLEFPNEEWVFAHVVAPLASHSPGLAPITIPVAEAMEAMREEGRKAVEAARSSLMGTRDKAKEYVLVGSAAPSLMSLADDERADLILAGSGRAKRSFPWMIGSVSRALSYGAKQSLLVTKATKVGKGPVHAIFATDHSDYAKCAVEKLIEWAPKGIARIDVLTAYDVTESTRALLTENTEVSLDFEEWVRENTLSECRIVAKQLKAVAAETHARVEKGEVNSVLSNAMSSTKADLLILGAQGHGFIERLLVGSTSLHQLVAEPYPVLLIRLPS